MTKLIIAGITASFTLDSLCLTNEGHIEISSGELAKYFTSLATPSAPAAPVIEWVAADNLEYTLDQYKASGWDDQQLKDAGFLVCKEVTASAPQAPAAPSAPKAPERGVPEVPKIVETKIAGQFTVDNQLYMLTAKAAGASYEQFTSAGWSLESLVSEGYVTQIGGKGINAETEAPKEYPFLNESGDWIDSAGVVFDLNLHSMGSDKVPAVTTKGIFKKTRRKAPTVAPASPETETTSGVPAAPNAETEANSIPAAPSASGVPTAPNAGNASAAATAATIEDEPLDEELANIVKDWN